MVFLDLALKDHTSLNRSSCSISSLPIDVILDDGARLWMDQCSPRTARLRVVPRSRLPLRTTWPLLTGSDPYPWAPPGRLPVGLLSLSGLIAAMTAPTIQLARPFNCPSSMPVSPTRTLSRTKSMFRISASFVNLSTPDSSTPSPAILAESLFSDDAALPPSLLLQMPTLPSQPTPSLRSSPLSIDSYMGILRDD
jgi:hypothetical protein